MDSSEEKRLEEFMQITKDLNQDRATLLRFLRARDGDLVKAERMLKNSLEWRDVNNVSSYRSWEPPEVLAKDYILRYVGEDREGFPVIYVPLGRWNIRDRINDGYLEETYLFRFYVLEGFILKHVEESKKDQFVLLLDMLQLSFYKCAHMDTMNMVIKMFQDFESNYPERLKSVLIVNAPWVFPYAFSIVKPCMQPKTLQKVQIYDGSSKKWLCNVTQHIPQDIIPTEAIN